MHTDEELTSSLQELIKTETTNFQELCELVGLDIKNDLKGTDLSGMDLSETDLSGANLSETDLSGANLTNCKLFKSDINQVTLTDEQRNQIVIIDDSDQQKIDSNKQAFPQNPDYYPDKVKTLCDFVFNHALPCVIVVCMVTLVIKEAVETSGTLPIKKVNQVKSQEKVSLKKADKNYAPPCEKASLKKVSLKKADKNHTPSCEKVDNGIYSGYDNKYNALYMQKIEKVDVAH
jgi:hypothetical protein